LIALTAVPTMTAASSDRLTEGHPKAFLRASRHRSVDPTRIEGSPWLKHGTQCVQIFSEASKLAQQRFELSPDNFFDLAGEQILLIALLLRMKHVASPFLSSQFLTS
jgi:hypothetical protein